MVVSWPLHFAHFFGGSSTQIPTAKPWPRMLEKTRRTSVTLKSESPKERNRLSARQAEARRCAYGGQAEETNITLSFLFNTLLQSEGTCRKDGNEEGKGRNKKWENAGWFWVTLEKRKRKREGKNIAKVSCGHSAGD